MNCPSCGVEVVGEVLFCHRCGTRLPWAQAPGASEGNASGMPQSPPVSESEPSPAPPSAQPPRLGEPTLRQPLGEEKEQELWQGGYSGKDMYEAWLLYAVLSLVLLVLSIWVNTTWLWWGSAILIVGMWVYGTLVLTYRKWSVAYRLTNRRFFHEKGLLRRVTDRLELIDIDDITVEQSLIDRWVGVGTIKITSSDRTHPVLELKGIKDARHVADIMDDARLDERRRRGLHIEAV